MKNPEKKATAVKKPVPAKASVSTPTEQAVETRPTKLIILARIDALKDQGKEWLSPEEVGEILGYTRSWVWMNLRIVSDSGKVIRDGKITAVQDKSRGKKKRYFLVHILKLEEDVEKRLYPKMPRG